MAYLRIRFRTGAETAARVGSALEAHGALAVTMENAEQDAFFETDLADAPDWRTQFVTGLFRAGVCATDIAASVSAAVGAALEPRIDTLPEQDWERAWLHDYQPLRISDEFWVCPSWCAPPDPAAVNLIMDPGLAFGTGTHATTALCLQWLARRSPPPVRVLDYGCGSGILAIAALLLGAEHAVGVDVDPRALMASETNARRNGVAERYQACTPNEIRTDLRVDLLMANILAEVIVSLADRLIPRVVPGGRILLSGVLDTQVNALVRRFEADFQLTYETLDNWALLIGCKK